MTCKLGLRYEVFEHWKAWTTQFLAFKNRERCGFFFSYCEDIRLSKSQCFVYRLVINSFNAFSLMWSLGRAYGTSISLSWSHRLSRCSRTSRQRITNPPLPLPRCNRCGIDPPAPLPPRAAIPLCSPMSGGRFPHPSPP